MDFLDPRRKRAHRRRLVIGYALMSIVVAMGTLLFLYLAYGYDIDRKTGTVIQNGIVFVDSKPQGAQVFLDGVLQNSRTDTRLNLPAGAYTIKIRAEGYRDWERTINLEGGEIERLVYPLLIPNVLQISDVKQYTAQPQLATQSPDRRWLLVQLPGQTYQFDVFDLGDPEKAPTQVIIPVAQLTNPSADASLEVVEWSTNNRHVLFARHYDKNTEYLMFDRENPNDSINLNKMLGINPKKVSLKNKRPDQFYFLDALPGVLRTADSKNKTISAPLLNEVIDYKTYGDDIVLYVTQENAATGKADFRILEGNKTYNLKTVGQADAYVMDVSKYDGEWYYVAGSAADNMVFVYENPLPALKQEVSTPLIVRAIMRLDNPRFVSFSANTEYIGVQSGNKLLTIDLEDDRQYRSEIPLNIPLKQELKWMDGNRFMFTVDQQSYIIDFDGSNQQTLVTSRLAPGPFWDRDYDNVFTFEDSKSDNSKKALTITIIDNTQ